VTEWAKAVRLWAVWRLWLRNITEFHTFDDALDLNLLFTYRVNAGTVFMKVK
jgi:hypothetical protein